jgi:DNA repair ATPase RecN
MEMAKKHAAEIMHIEKELVKAQEKRRRLFDDYEEGNYTAEEFRERKVIWADRIERMTFELEELQHTKPEEIDYQEKIVSFTKALEALQDNEISAKEKNILLKDIIETIEYSRADDSYHTGEITLDIILKD